MRTFLFLIILSLFVASYGANYASDSEEYRRVYELVGSGATFDSVGRSEYFYFVWNWLFGSLGISFEFFLFFSTLVFLSAKLAALYKMSYTSNMTAVVVIYTSIFFLLHESIQYKIAWALSISLWGCFCIVKRRNFIAVLLTLVASGFHITAVLLPLGFLFSHKFLNSSKRIIIFVTFVLLLSPIALQIIEFIVSILSNFDPRYLDYISTERMDAQNTSGLFGVYVILNTAFVFFIFFKSCGRVNKIISAEAASMILAVSILIILRDFVAMSSRLSDVLMLLCIPVMVNLWTQFSSTDLALKIVIPAYCFSIFLARVAVNWNFFV